VFVTLRHGLGTLTGTLAGALLTGGADVRVATVAAARPTAAGVTVVADDGTELDADADACIVATPARSAARILVPVPRPPQRSSRASPTRRRWSARSRTRALQGLPVAPVS
jgi:protoporphyrinogen oxidase